MKALISPTACLLLALSMVACRVPARVPPATALPSPAAMQASVTREPPAATLIPSATPTLPPATLQPSTTRQPRTATPGPGDRLPQPAATSTPEARRTATPTPGCSPKTTLVPFATPRSPLTPGTPPKDLAGVIAALPGILSQYPGDLGALYVILGGWGALEAGREPLRQVDLDDDGILDVLLLLSAPGCTASRDKLGPRGLAVLQRFGAGYVLRGSRIFDAPIGIGLEAPLLQDITGDGKTDLVVAYYTAAAHTAMTHVYVFGLLDGRLRELTSLPISTTYADLGFGDRNGDGKIEMILHGGAFGSADNGPVQMRTEIYAWDGRGFRLIDVFYDPSRYRIHVILDGDRALRKGDLATAVVSYERAASDPDLSDSGLGDGDQERRALQAFARYRLVTAYALLGDRDEAARALATLRSRHGGHPFQLLAEAFWQAWEPKKDIAFACTAATAYTRAHTEVLAAFGDYGYANPPLKLEDICFLK